MTVGGSGPSERRAHRESVQFTDQELIHQLRMILGSQVVADIAPVKETRAVRQWSDGERKPPAATMARLRSAYLIAAILHGPYSNTIVQAWFLSMNPDLENLSPVVLLRDGPLEETGPPLLAAAREFAAEVPPEVRETMGAS